MTLTMATASASPQKDMATILRQAGLTCPVELTDRHVKVAVVGNKGAGKTSFIESFIQDIYVQPEVPEEKKWIKVVSYGGPEYEFQILLRELPAHDNLIHLREQAYLGSKAIVIIYSVADRESWEAIPKWATEAMMYAPEAQVYVVGNKMELRENEAPVSRKEGKDMARTIRAEKYYEISSYTGNHVHDMVISMEKRFKYLTDLYDM